MKGLEMKRFFTFTRADVRQIATGVVVFLLMASVGFLAGQQAAANPVAPPVPEWHDGELIVSWDPAAGTPIAHRLYSSQDGAPWELVGEYPWAVGAVRDTVTLERVPGLWSWYVCGVFMESIGDSMWTFKGPPGAISKLSAIPDVGPPGQVGRARLIN